MELIDTASPLIHKIITTCDDKEGFENCDIALLVGARPRSKGMQRKDLLEANAKIFKHQATFLDQYANPDCKICVVGNPANTNAAILASFCKNIKKSNITALTRLDQNRALGQVSLKTGTPFKFVRNAVIWGNHSSTQYPDLQICEVLKDSQVVKARELIESQWEENDFIKRVQKRGAEIIQQRKLSSAASAANAVCDHIRSWILGTQPGEIVSMAVYSDGNPYGVSSGLIFSFPVTCENGQWKIVSNLNLSSEFSKKMIQATQEELSNEKETALNFLSKN